MPDRQSSISIRGLRDGPDPGLSGATTPVERLALVETLTREAWALARGDRPMYSRHEAPVSVRPLHVNSPRARR